MSALDEQLLQCNKDIEEVQRVLDANLTLLSEHVDQGFDQLRSINNLCGDIACQLSNSGHRKAANVVEWAGLAISCVGGAIEGVRAARAHNAALAKMMQQKIKIANEKYDSISRIQKIAERNSGTLNNLFYQVLTQEYRESDLVAKPANAKGIIKEIKRVSDLYSVSQYNLLMIGFLLDEYKAWMNHRQKSGTRRPIPSFVKYSVNEWMFDRENGMGLNLGSVVSRKGRRGKITGAELLFLTDSSISSCSFYNQMSNGAVCGLGVEPGGIAKNLLENNNAYKGYVSSLSDYEGWWHGPVLGALVIVGLSVWFDIACWGWMSGWWAFFRWVAMIIICLIEYGLLSAVCPTLFNGGDRQELLGEICNEAQKKQLDEMGYVEIYEPDLEEKNVWKEGAKGIWSSLFG